jgi:hypothetical protein
MFIKGEYEVKIKAKKNWFRDAIMEEYENQKKLP